MRVVLENYSTVLNVRPLIPGFSRYVAPVLAGVIALGVGGCSLMKVNLGGEPMPARDLSLRMQTREHAAAFSARIVMTADVIAAEAESPEVRANTIRWKLAATSALQQSSLRSEPVLSLVDTWTLCRQMHEFFASPVGGQLFSTNSQRAVTLTAALEDEIAGMAGRILPSGEFERAASFVKNYASAHPLKSLALERESIALAWQQEDDAATPAVGNTPEAIADLADRVSGFGQQIPVEVRWRMDLERAELEPLVEQMKRLSAGAEAVFQAFPVMAENARMVADAAKTVSKSASELTQTLAPELARFDQQWVATLATLKTEREAVMEVVRTERIAVVKSLEAQREALTRDFAKERAEIAAVADRVTQNAIAQTGQQVRALISSVLIYIILLVLVVLGLPFLSGYWLGRARKQRDANSSSPPKQ